jgi:DNA topoisomerase-1
VTNGPGALRFVDDGSPGISRRRKGRYWQYFDADGNRITDRDEIDRLNAIGMPPAYRDCWFCADPDGHLQAIGFDARGRKQYRYHPDFRAHRDDAKFDRLAAFGRSLPKLRRRIDEDLKGRPTSCEAVIAAVIRLIDATHMRVGNEEYAQANKSFGATTLRNRHARVGRDRLRICYRGKHGLERTVTVTDRSLARVARKVQELPGQNLFQFLNDEGEPRPVRSNDVNDYIREATGEEFTAKDFRTWGASVIAFEEMARRGRESGRVGLKSVIEPVAEALGNTAAISRKSYVHPGLIETVKSGDVPEIDLPRATRWLSGAERGLIEFLDGLGKKRRQRRKAA